MIGFLDPNFWMNFWPGFWANLTSGIIVSIILTWLLSRVYKSMNKAKAVMYFQLAQITSGQQAITFTVRNEGRVNFATKEVYWMVLQACSPPEAQALSGCPHFRRIVTIEGRDFALFSEFIKDPMFPDSQVDVLTLPVSGSPDSCRAYYALSTAYGRFPKGLRRAEDGGIDNTSLMRAGQVKSLIS